MPDVFRSCLLQKVLTGGVFRTYRIEKYEKGCRQYVFTPLRNKRLPEYD